MGRNLKNCLGYHFFFKKCLHPSTTTTMYCKDSCKHTKKVKAANIPRRDHTVDTEPLVLGLTLKASTAFLRHLLTLPLQTFCREMVQCSNHPHHLLIISMSIDEIPCSSRHLDEFRRVRFIEDDRGAATHIIKWSRYGDVVHPRS